MGVPTLYVRMLGEAALTRQACAHMRLFISGSAPLLPRPSRLAAAHRPHHPRALRHERDGDADQPTPTPRQRAPRRHGGLPAAGRGRARARRQGHAAGRGEIGGIEVKGPNVFKGYWRMPEKTADEFTTDLWFKTGDVGRIDADGYVTIVGRSKDLIISGGYNVYPAEIEGYLNDMPGVAESAVVGVPHPDFGEAVVAVVVPKPGAALDGKRDDRGAEGQIANFKVPKAVFVVPDLPRNAMGKVQKNLLRDQHRALFAK
jgi:malonyl-CoA/methylmalonyl-CoA synthetase